MKIGDGLDETVTMGPQVNKQQVETTVKYVDIGKNEGAKVAVGGSRLSGDKYRGWFHEPTIFTNAHAKMRISQEEIFGPVTTIIPTTSVEEAAEIANSTPYGLSSAIYTRDINKAFRAIRDINAGITYVNAPTIGAEVHLPFGGVKATGNGHREGSEAIEFFSTWKAVYIDYSDKLQRAQIDNE
jgi:aldehyde dehydrogenase (NAD+)